MIKPRPIRKIRTSQNQPTIHGITIPKRIAEEYSGISFHVIPKYEHIIILQSGANP
jgi:hypothetical protein